MAATQKEVLNALLDTLLNCGLIDKSAHGKARNIVNSTRDFPEFFGCYACCRKEDTDGCA